MGNALLTRPRHEISQATEDTLYRTSVGKLDENAAIYRDVRITRCILKKYLLYDSILSVPENPRKCSLVASCE